MAEQQKKGDKCLQYIQSHGYQPNEEVCVLYRRNGQSYWVHGYSIFNPHKIVSNPNGATVIEWEVIKDQLPVVTTTNKIFVKPAGFALSRIKRKSEVPKSYSFHEVFK
jgi:hypothetical protein